MQRSCLPPTWLAAPSPRPQWLRPPPPPALQLASGAHSPQRRLHLIHNPLPSRGSTGRGAGPVTPCVGCLMHWGQPDARGASFPPPSLSQSGAQQLAYSYRPRRSDSGAQHLACCVTLSPTPTRPVTRGVGAREAQHLACAYSPRRRMPSLRVDNQIRRFGL